MGKELWKGQRAEKKKRQRDDQLRVRKEQEAVARARENQPQWYKDATAWPKG